MKGFKKRKGIHFLTKNVLSVELQPLPNKIRRGCKVSLNTSSEFQALSSSRCRTGEMGSSRRMAGSSPPRAGLHDEAEKPGVPLSKGKQSSDCKVPFAPDALQLRLVFPEPSERFVSH